MLSYQNLQTNRAISLLQLCEDFRRQKLVLPAWQRGIVWSPEQKSRWIDMLADVPDYLERYEASNFDIPGVITVFTIRGSDSPKFLNDGNNRTQVSLAYLKSLKEKQKLTDAEVIQRLSRVQIQFQEWQFEKMIDAFIQWNNMNQGTVLTSFESGRGALAILLEDFPVTWKQFFDDLDAHMLAEMSRLATRNEKKRIKTHKFQRDNSALLYRYLSEDKTESDYASGRGQLCLTEQEIREGKSERGIFEFPLAKKLTELGIEGSRKVLQDFTKQISKDMALIISLYRPYEEYGACFSWLASRWILHALCYFRNRGIPYELYYKFLQQTVFVCSKTPRQQDKALVEKETGDKEESIWRQFGLGDIKKLSTVARIIQNDSIVAYAPVKRRRNIKKKMSNYLLDGPQDGVQISHMYPVSVNGEGPTILEHAAANLSRGAEEITEIVSVLGGGEY